MEIVRDVRPPRGLAGALFRLPAKLYKIGLGGLFGRRIMVVNHVGRVTGKPRQAVVEVIEHDADAETYVVASGWGETAAWYRNLLHTPDVTIQVGRRTMPVTAVPLEPAEGAEVMARYGRRHRIAARFMLPRVLGVAVDGSDADFRAVGRHLPFIRFVPRRRERVS